MNKEQSLFTFEYHRLHPEISIDEHVKNRTIELGRLVNGKERIYLDLRFWILFRDVTLGRIKDQAIIDLLELLKAKVRLGLSICPISESIFIELFKQQDKFTRAKTAVLIDELSEGVTLAPYPDRVSSEIAHFFHDLGGKEELWPIEFLVWSKLSNILGIQHPFQTPFDASEELVIQKTLFDHMWEISLKEIVEKIGDTTPSPPLMSFAKLATKLNKSNADHADEIRNFKQVYNAEMVGGLSLFMPVARQVLEQMYERAIGQPVTTNKKERLAHEKELLTFFQNAIEKREVCVRLRSSHIHALCHAAYRFDKKRNLKKNDFFDFYHASAGIGYCNYFITVNPLRSLLQQKHLKIGRAHV